MQINKNLCTLFCCLIGFTAASMANEKTIYGRYEKVEVKELGGVAIPAKLDTGAMTASLNAVDIVLFEKEGKQWVRFTPQINGKNYNTIEKPVVRLAKIKRRPGDHQKKNNKLHDKSKNQAEYTDRPEVRMEVCLGGTLRTIEVNLTDRSTFDYPMLIGAKALREFKAIVDPSLKYQSEANCLAK